MVVVFFNFWLEPGREVDVLRNNASASTSTTKGRPTTYRHHRRQRFNVTKTQPVFVVGLPKSGTTSIHQMFQCSSNIYRSQHYCCCGSNRTHTRCDDVEGGQLMAECMRKNLKSNRSILSGCGSYDVYAEMDAEFGNSKFQRITSFRYQPVRPVGGIGLRIR